MAKVKKGGLFYIESPDGAERQLVSSTEGYEGWRVVASGVDRPDDDCDWCPHAKAFKPNDGRRAKRLAQQQARDGMGMLQRIEHLEQLVAELIAARYGGNSEPGTKG